MKIRTKLTIRYTAVTAAVFLFFIIAIYLFSSVNRENTFYRNLKKEGITKANLFLENRVDAKVMQSIYQNNRGYVDEVEVAVYDTSFHLLYHDAKEIDIVKETPEMINRIIRNKSIEFYEDKYQVIGLLYTFKGQDYVITAAAYDGYGEVKQEALAPILLIIWIAGLVILAIVGYFLAKGALSPVSSIVKKVETLSPSNLDSRIPITNEKDELGELSITFNRMLDRLEKTFESQKMFISHVSHELRTPMAALIGELEIALLRERDAASYKRTIENALNDSLMIVKLSEGLLNLAKASYHPEQIKMEEVRLDELLLDTREVVLKANKNFKINLIFDQEAEDDTSITVIGNPYLLKIAFQNLMENNCKYSDDHTSTVQISFFETKSILRFSDTGTGISTEDLKQLFQPFYRGANHGNVSGNGIGMTLVQKIILLHKGDIHVHSHLGEGTVFRIEMIHI